MKDLLFSTNGTMVQLSPILGSFSWRRSFPTSLKVRASITRLSNKDLSEFLIETLFKGGFKVLASVLFILFRSFKCMVENGVGRVAQMHIAQRGLKSTYRFR